MSFARFRTPAPLAASLVAILAFGVAGCGSSAHHTSTIPPGLPAHLSTGPAGTTPSATTAAATTPDATTSAATTPGGTTSGATTDSAAPPLSATAKADAAKVPPTDVALVDGTPITLANFDHWLKVTIYSNTAGAGGTPVVPDPPNFTQCIAEARTIVKLKSESTLKLRNDCEVLLASDTGQTMDFLIKNIWVEKAAAASGIAPSAAAVKHQFLIQKAKEFKSPAKFKAFLARTKQTVSDILQRIRINGVLSVLSKQAHGARALETELEFTYKPKTYCTATYAISDCAGVTSTVSSATSPTTTTG